MQIDIAFFGDIKAVIGWAAVAFLGKYQGLLADWTGEHDVF